MDYGKCFHISEIKEIKKVKLEDEVNDYLNGEWKLLFIGTEDLNKYNSNGIMNESFYIIGK